MLQKIDLKQGSCGNCYANVAVAQIESDAMRLLSKTYVLSRQQVTDCGNVGGCGGGWPRQVFEYVKSIGGLMLESDYPYTSGTSGAVGATCNFNSSKVKVTVDSHYNIGGYLTIEPSVAAYVQSVGPASVLVYAVPLQSYASGLMTVCDNAHLSDHVLQAVGVFPATTGGYWYVSN